MQNLPYGALVELLTNPEWGKWIIQEDCGDWYNICGDGGTRTLFKEEAIKEWKECYKDNNGRYLH